MKGKVSLGKLTLLYTFGNFSSKILRFGLFFIYTFFLSKEDIGFYDLVVTSVLIATPLISFQVYDALFRNILEVDSQSTVSKYTTNSFALIFINLIVFTLIFLLFGKYINVEYKWFIYLFMVSETIYQVFPQLARGMGENRIFVASGILYSLLLFIGSILFLIVLDFGVQGLIFSSILAGIVGSLFMCLKLNIFKYLSFQSFSIDTIKEIVIYSLPLVPNTLSWWAISNANRFLILEYLGLEDNGFYAVGQKLPAILIMFTSIFNLAWTEKAITNYTSSNKDEYFNNIFNKYLTLLFSLIVILIATSKILLSYIVDPTYFEVWKFLPLLYIATFFQSLSSFLGTAYISSKETKGAFLTTVYGSVANLGLAYLLIPRLGLIGAAVAVCVGFYVMFQIRYFNTKKYFKVSLDTGKIILYPLIGLAITLIYVFGNTYWQVLNVILCFSIFIILNKEVVNTGIIKGRKYYSNAINLLQGQER